MSKNQKLDFKINCSPHLKMSEITKRLFNRNFHSDVQFLVQDQIIYAHSLELIKRSVVFEAELENTIGEVTLIPIVDCEYEIFYAFIKYLYTDECSIDDNNGIELLKLAIKYRIVSLENQIINYGNTVNWMLKCFEHCILNKYEIQRKFLQKKIAWFSGFALQNKQFLLLHPEVIEEFLKFDRIPEVVTELKIFTAVANWITSNCEKNQISLSEGRERYDGIIRKIRFPTMTNEEIRECATKYPGLLSENDRKLIGSQTVFGDSNRTNDLWVSKPRENYQILREWRNFPLIEKFETTVSVSKDTILYGLRIGIERRKNPIEIEISETNEETNDSQKLMFLQNPYNRRGLVISLGDSIIFKPNFKYVISIKYLEIKEEGLEVRCRKETTNLIINDPSKTVNIIDASANMSEMFFKSVLD